MSDPRMHEPTRAPDLHDRSAPALIGDLITHVTELFRKEMLLLRAELNEKGSQVMTAVGMIAGALVLAITALNVLAAALVEALTEYMARGWAALIVGILIAAVAYFLASGGLKSLKTANLTPRRTAEAVSKDATMAKERVT
jgi:phosphoglycerol transferase MdoB-like AlkP superfamily enzyme